ncbi:uncharacterized protein LOC143038846 [Oratosquilla oratoria]|uniref:uncharacterized protein LOC143038846 n=1 Tax=Oratosquilla oratoria TaxID=337810 RepID=UPI003F776595
MKSTVETLKTDCPLGQQEPLEVILEMLGDEDEAQEEEQEEEEELEDEEYGVGVGGMVVEDGQGETMDAMQGLGIEHGQEMEEDYEAGMHETYSEAKENEREDYVLTVEKDEYPDKRCTTFPQEAPEAKDTEEAMAEDVTRHEGSSLLMRNDMASLTSRRASLTQYRFRSFDEGSGDENYPNEERERKLVHSFSSEGAIQSISSSSDSNQTVIECDTSCGSVTSLNDRKLSDIGRSSTDTSADNSEFDSLDDPNNVKLPVEENAALGNSQKIKDIGQSSESVNELEESDYLSAVENSIEVLDAMEWESKTSNRVVKRYLPPQNQVFSKDKSLFSSLEEEDKFDPSVEDFNGDDYKNNDGDRNRDRKGSPKKVRTPEEERQYSVLDPDYIERESRKIRRFIDNLYAYDETEENASRVKEKNRSVSVDSADNYQDALDLVSKSSKSSDFSNSSLFKPISDVQDEAGKRRGKTNYHRASSTEIRMPEVTGDYKIRKDENHSLIKNNTVTMSESKVKHNVTEDELSTSSEPFPTLRRSRLRERSKSPLEERKSFSEFSSPEHERIASALKYFDRSESPIGRCRSLSPVSIRLERIHRVHLKPLTSHSLYHSLERIHKINLSPLATFNYSGSDDIAGPSGEKCRNIGKGNIERSKQASAKDEQQIFELGNERKHRDIDPNHKADAEKQEYSNSFKKIVSPEEESTAEEQRRFEIHNEGNGNLGLYDKAIITKQERCFANSAKRISKENEVKLQRNYSYSENPPSKLGTLKRSKTIDFKTDIEDVDISSEKLNVEELTLTRVAKNLRSESDEVEKDVEHHDRPEKSKEYERIALPSCRSSGLSTLVKESVSFDSGHSISEEEMDPRDYVDPRVEDWVRSVDSKNEVSLDEDTSGSEVVREEEASSKEEEENDDNEDLPHFYDSDGTTPVAEIRHLPGELFTQDSREETEKREQWRSISQSTTPPNSPVSFQHEKIISQPPELGLSPRGEDLFMFSENSGASSVVSLIHNNVTNTHFPNHPISDTSPDKEMSLRPEFHSDDFPSPVKSIQTSIASPSQDLGSDRKLHFSEEQSQKECRGFKGGISNNNSSRENKSLQEIENCMTAMDACENTNSDGYSKVSESDLPLASRRDSIDKVNSPQDSGSTDEIFDLQDSKVAEKSPQKYKSFGAVSRDRDSAKGEECSKRKSPVVTAGGNIIYYEEDDKEQKHYKNATEAEDFTLGKDSLSKQKNGEDITVRRDFISGEELLKDRSDMNITASHYISDRESRIKGSKGSDPEDELQRNLSLETKIYQDWVSNRSFVNDSKALGLFPRKRRGGGNETDIGSTVCKDDYSSTFPPWTSNLGIDCVESTFKENSEDILSTACKSDRDGKLVPSRSNYYDGEYPATMPQRNENADSGGDTIKYKNIFSTLTSSNIKSDVDENVDKSTDWLSSKISKIQGDENVENYIDNSCGEESLIKISSRNGGDLVGLRYSECNLEEALVTISNTLRRVTGADYDTDCLHNDNCQAASSSKHRDIISGNIGEALFSQECERDQVNNMDKIDQNSLKPETNGSSVYEARIHGMCISQLTNNSGEEAENRNENDKKLSDIDYCLSTCEKKTNEAGVDFSKYDDNRTENDDDYTKSDELMKKYTLVEKNDETGKIMQDKQSAEQVSIHKEDLYRDSGSMKPTDDSTIQDVCRDIGNDHNEIMKDISDTKCHATEIFDNIHVMIETDCSKPFLAAESHNVNMTGKTEDDMKSLPSDQKATEDHMSILHEQNDVVKEMSDMSTLMEAKLPGESNKTGRNRDRAGYTVSKNYIVPNLQQGDKALRRGSNGETDTKSKIFTTINPKIDNGKKNDEEGESNGVEDDDEDVDKDTGESNDLTATGDTSQSDKNKENDGCNEDEGNMSRSSEERTPTKEGKKSPGDTGEEQGTNCQACHRGDSYESYGVRSKITNCKLSSENENYSSQYYSANDGNLSVEKRDVCMDKKLDTDSKQPAAYTGSTVKENEVREGTNLSSAIPTMSKTDNIDDIDKKIENIILENQRCYFIILTFLKKLDDRLKFSNKSVAALPSKLTTTTTKTQYPDAISAGSASKAQPSTDAKSVSALHLAAEGRDYLMWCPDRDFDRAVATLDVRGLVDLVQTLQDAMAVEQQTFDSLTQQLELVSDPLVQQRLSAALCTSQTRLARLCSRNMRCFTQQALKARQKDESRSSSPRDSGLVMSSSGGVSDVERDPRSPTTVSFKNSLAFFQRASNIVPTNTRNAPTESLKESHRRSSRGSSTCTSGSEDLNLSGGFIEDLPTGGDFVGSVSYLDRGGEGGGGGGGRGYGEDEYDLEKFEDHGTYEQVLFINGRPQYQGGAIHGDPRDERCGIGEQSDRSSSTRVRIDGSTGRSLVLEEASGVRGGGGGGGGRGSEFVVGLTPAHSVANYSSLPRRAHARARKGVTAVAEDELRRGLLQEQREQPQVNSDLGGYVTLPRRKPYLNFRSVSCGPNPGSAEFDNDDLSYFKEKVGISRSNSAHAITRTQSCKEGLNHSSEFYDSSAYGLSRTQSFHDGLAGDFNAVKSVKPKLQRAPSVDEILESVKSLRAKKNMVKSTPDLVGSQESSPYHSTSLTRHKGKSHRTSGSASSLLGVRYNGSSYGEESNYDQMPEPDYEQIRESSSASSNVTMNPFYENLVRDNYYENVHLKGEVIYDNPRPTEHHYDRVHDDIHYENLDYDDPVYENVHEKEPTYMNVSDSSTLSSTASSSSRKSKSKVYANLEPVTGAQQKGHGSSGSSDKGKGKSRGKVTVTGGSSVVEGLTYDVPRAATHIYDSPQKQIRSVMPAATQAQASEYDTPKSNRSVLPQSTQIVLKTKKEQKQRIDDIFADCDQDSLDGADMEPDIPSPDYGSEEEPESLDEKPATKDTFTSSDLADEGLGDTDSRSYYTEEQGLEVILEEPEEEDCISAASEDDLRRDVDISHELKGERRSLDGSEGIGSAEGDCHSSGGSEHYVEEDCASSGIHSQDTPSPGPPVEDHPCTKDDLNPRGGVANEEERIQKDRCVEVYPETVRQRQRNNNMSSSNKVDIKNWTSSSNKGDANSPSKVKKFLPSVKALRNQFETGKTNHVTNGSTPSPASTPVPTLSRKSSSSNSSLASSTLEKTSSTNSLASTENGSTENLVNSDIREFVENERTVIMDPDEPVEPIFNQFKSVDEELKELMSKPPSTTGWNPLHLLKRLYFVPEAPKMKSEGTTYINIEGYLEKLPSGRKKATFWNAWKRRYFIAKDGILYYYQNNQAEKPSMKLPLMGGKVECMEPNMVGVDDGKGHYVVVRCSSRQEAERWRRALETHTVEDFSNQYVQPWPVPTNPTLLRDTLVVDLGSCSVRAGVLASNPTLPQLFFPCVVATQRDSRRQTWGLEALDPDVRSSASLSFPIRPSLKITKYSVDLNAVSSLLQKTFADLKVDPKNYNLQLSVPRILNPNTQVELLKILFDKFECRSVNLTHQSILSLYAYNATSGIVVDLGERMDIVPVIDGYIVDGGVSRVPYGGYRILDHLRQFLYMRNVSLVTEVEGYILRYVLENLCYCAQHYNTEKARCTNNPDNFEKSVTLGEFFHGRDCPYETISLDFGRFQSTEGVFNPDAWGLDHPGLHKLVHKAIQECSMDIRKEMSRSIFLVGGASQLPGLAERLTTELDNLTPPAIRPKVHCSPHRYHAAYLGACVLAESNAFQQSKITREEWNKYGNASIRKWSL